MLELGLDWELVKEMAMEWGEGVGVEVGVRVGVGFEVGVGERVGVGIAVGFGVGVGVGLGVGAGVDLGVGVGDGVGVTVGWGFLATTCTLTNAQINKEIRNAIIRICSFFIFLIHSVSCLLSLFDSLEVVAKRKPLGINNSESRPRINLFRELGLT